ncbi:MAG: hypothetical protein RIS70_1205, partial [Planctomycetota bacterium]
MSRVRLGRRGDGTGANARGVPSVHAGQINSSRIAQQERPWLRRSAEPYGKDDQRLPVSSAWWFTTLVGQVIANAFEL